MRDMLIFTVLTVAGISLMGFIGLLTLYRVLSKLFSSWRSARDVEILKISQDINVIKEANSRTLIWRSEYKYIINNMNGEVSSIKDSVFSQEDKIEKLQYELDSKLGSDIEYFADDILVRLTTLTPFAELKRYLNKKRDLLVGEVKRLMSMGIAYAQPEILQKSWDNVHYQLQEYSKNLSLEFNMYNDYSEPLRQEELIQFETNIMHIVKSGNGSKDKLFLTEAKIYIRKQLEFTFKDYQDYIVAKSGECVENQNQNMIEYLHSLIIAGKIELTLYHLQFIIKKSRNQDLKDSLILLSAKYHLYQKDENSGVCSTADLKIEIAKINRAIVAYINSAIPQLPDLRH